MWHLMTWEEKRFLLMSVFTSNLFLVLAVAIAAYTYYVLRKKTKVYPDEYLQDMWFTFVALKNLKRTKEPYVLFDGRSYALQIIDKKRFAEELREKAKNITNSNT